ncbi:MAG: hypothetical protein JWO91_1041 [Acidobacteriaceae bacterium]|jgi:uncharacterized protein (DUF302 family)|nr:hypothetical protein [Acidobacteriaceae bacterium]
MTTQEINVQRLSVTSSKPFRDVVAAFEKAVGHPDVAAFEKNLAAAKSFAELERIVREAVGPTELMEFTRMDLGEVLRKRNGVAAPRSLRFLVGNPVIMSQMVEHAPDAGSYAPVTILIDERPDGVHLSYDRMASFLAPYGNSQALKVAQDLDSKIETLLTTAAS